MIDAGEECFVCKGVGLVHIVPDIDTEEMVDRADNQILGPGDSNALRKFTYFLLRWVLAGQQPPGDPVAAGCTKCGRVQAWPHFCTVVTGTRITWYCSICALEKGI